MYGKFLLNGYGNTSDALTCVIFLGRTSRNAFSNHNNYHTSFFGGTTSLFSGMTYGTFGRPKPGNLFQNCLKYHNNIKTYGFPVSILFMYSTSCTKNEFLSFYMYRYKIMCNLQVLQYRCTSCTNPENRFSQYRVYCIKLVL